MEDVAAELLLVQTELADVISKIQKLESRKRHLENRAAQLQVLVSPANASGDVALTHEPEAPVDILAAWSGPQAWDKQARDALHSVFGLPSFRPTQREAINCFMAGRDMFLIQPTGAGKSVVFQLPAIIRPGISLVISPLLSLIHDQVTALTQQGVKAAMITGGSTAADAVDVLRSVEQDDGVKLVYTTPEKVIKSKKFMAQLEKLHTHGRLSGIIIDEAHCCSQWGHDFRPDYQKLGILKTQFRTVPIMAVTATASARVVQDVCDCLRLPKPVIFRHHYARDNLYYVVLRKADAKKDAHQQVVDLVKSFSRQEAGIVYCLSRADTEEVATALTDNGVRAATYHADMLDHHKTGVHEKWMNGVIQVVVATIAFGMGINKKDVRFVVHHSLSNSLEAYYQESGRAGRDGNPAVCALLYNPSDVFRMSCMVFYREQGLNSLYELAWMCQSVDECRRKFMNKALGAPPADSCSSCDVCTAAARCDQVNDVTAATASVVAFLREAHKSDAETRLTPKMLFKAWKSAQTGELKKLSQDDFNNMLCQSVLVGAVSQEFYHSMYQVCTHIVPGPRATQVASGSLAVQIRSTTADLRQTLRWYQEQNGSGAAAEPAPVPAAHCSVKRNAPAAVQSKPKKPRPPTAPEEDVIVLDGDDDDDDFVH